MFLLGTAHLSARSTGDVRRLIAAVQPESVVVELCRQAWGAKARLKGGRAGRQCNTQGRLGGLNTVLVPLPAAAVSTGRVAC